MYIDSRSGLGRASVTFKPVTLDQLEWLTGALTGATKAHTSRSAIVGLAIDVLYRTLRAAKPRSPLAIPTKEEADG